MAYRPDPNLEFLANMKSSDLNDLVKILVYDKDRKKRYTEELSSTDKYWKNIAREIQKFGGNTIANIWRGKGVLYKEVLRDVCKKLNVNYNKNSSVKTMEDNLLMKILEDSLEKMSSKDIEKLVINVGIKEIHKRITPKIAVNMFKKIFKRGGDKSYELTVIIANSVMKSIGLSSAANVATTKIISLFTGPLGLVLSGVWTVSGPAYRVTIPAVIEIAVLRKKYLYELEEKKKEMERKKKESEQKKKELERKKKKLNTLLILLIFIILLISIYLLYFFQN
jgi:uncharacterized protein YaaW (UPF0174 family)/predicted nucleic acid-binding Zn ribbon protein